jgi:hypothetical protein
VSALSTAVPFDLDLNGERVTVTAVTGTGPWTLTVVRGVAPTVARAHAAGEPVEAWAPALVAF